jgi:hypothetical protein
MFLVSMKVIANSNLEKREISESTSHQTSVLRSKHAGVKWGRLAGPKYIKPTHCHRNL